MGLAYLAVGLLMAAILVWIASGGDDHPTEFIVDLPTGDDRTVMPAPDTPDEPDVPAGTPDATAPDPVDQGPPEIDLGGIVPPSPPDEPAGQAQPLRLAVKERTEIFVPAPHPALIEETPLGLLPIIADDGRQSWQVYARPFDDSDQRPQIAVVIGGLGLGKGVTNQAIQLPGSVTLAFAPYATELEIWIDRARAAGHEILLELPMEPDSFPRDDPGPRALLTSLRPADNVERLDWLLSRFVGYVGVIGPANSKFTRSREHLAPLLETVAARGLLYLDNDLPGGQPNPLPSELAGGMNLLFLDSDFEIDSQASRLVIQRRLDEIEAAARAAGTVVAVGRPYPVTMEMLAEWLPGLNAKGIAIAPISAVGARRISG